MLLPRPEAREPESPAERGLTMCDPDAVSGRHIPPHLPPADAPERTRAVSLSEAVARFEKDLIERALETTRGNRAMAARRLGSTERIVNYKIGKYGIDCDRFRG